MTRRNRTSEARAISQETARKTSSRPEILEARSKNLESWRRAHPDDFYEKCTRKTRECWQSKPEMKLGEVLALFDEFKFSRNQVLKSETFITRSKRKQVDYADKLKRVYVEFDGVRHFRAISGEDLLLIKERDRLLNEHIERNGWTLIRVSYDTFKYARGGHFTAETVEEIGRLLRGLQPGVHFIGSSYREHA